MPRHQIGKTDLSDYATKDYVDGGTWVMPPIVEWYDPTGGLPVAPEIGDRYGADATAEGWTIDYIYEWDGDEWVETEPEEGWMIWVLFELLFYVFFSGGWMEVGEGSYVPYTGASTDVDLGANNLTATSIIETTPTLLRLSQATPQTITGGIPLLTGLTPINDYDISTKKYVDDEISGVTETDPLSIHRDGSVDLTGDWTITGGDIIFDSDTKGMWWGDDKDISAIWDNINSLLEFSKGIKTGGATSGQSSIDKGMVVNEGGGGAAEDDFRAETDNEANALVVDASADEILVNVPIKGIEGTEIESTGEGGGTKYLREDGDDTCSWQTPSGIKLSYMVPIWAEENAALGDATYEWAFGNGADTPSNAGITIYVPSGYTCAVVAMSATTNNASGTSVIEANINGTLKGALCNVTISGRSGTNDSFTPVAIVDGDRITFRTTTAGTNTAPSTATAWLRYEQT